MRPERRRSGELASKLPDKSIIRVLGETASAGGHRWLGGTGCQVQHTGRVAKQSCSVVAALLGAQAEAQWVKLDPTGTESDHQLNTNKCSER